MVLCGSNRFLLNAELPCWGIKVESVLRACFILQSDSLELVSLSVHLVFLLLSFLISAHCLASTLTIAAVTLKVCHLELSNSGRGSSSATEFESEHHLASWASDSRAVKQTDSHFFICFKDPITNQ